MIRSTCALSQHLQRPMMRFGTTQDRNVDTPQQDIPLTSLDTPSQDTLTSNTAAQPTVDTSPPANLRLAGEVDRAERNANRSIMVCIFLLLAGAVTFSIAPFKRNLPPADNNNDTPNDVPNPGIQPGMLPAFMSTTSHVSEVDSLSTSKNSFTKNDNADEATKSLGKKQAAAFRVQSRFRESGTEL